MVDLGFIPNVSVWLEVLTSCTIEAQKICGSSFPCLFVHIFQHLWHIISRACGIDEVFNNSP